MITYYEAISDCSKWQDIYAQLNSGSYLANGVCIIIIIIIIIITTTTTFLSFYWISACYFYTGWHYQHTVPTLLVPHDDTSFHKVFHSSRAYCFILLDFT
jgi:archaellum biogenesis protein FlaJ (TadC family)